MLKDTQRGWLPDPAAGMTSRVPRVPASVRNDLREGPALSEIRGLEIAPLTGQHAATTGRVPRVDFGGWRSSVRQTVLAAVADFFAARCARELDRGGVDAAGDILAEFISGGKCLRSTIMYLGWLCGESSCDAALRAAASLELLHAFALLQDDVMDDAPQRRGRPTAHIQFADWHRDSGLSGCGRRFGKSAATILGDLCLIWAEQMFRESGVASHRLQRAWPRYDAMRTELAVGQFGDLRSDIRDLPELETVLDVARRKSGNYTVRRPLEIGAVMAGCSDDIVAQLGRYGAAVGEAFQLRDDMLDVFGAPDCTGKPFAGDLLERKATSVAVTAHRLADAPTRRELIELMHSSRLDSGSLLRWKELIVETGATQWIEDMISERVAVARQILHDMTIDEPVRDALEDMAVACAERTA